MIAIVVALWVALASCTGGAAPAPASPSSSSTGSGAVMTASGVYISIGRAPFKVAKVRSDGDVLTATVTYTGRCAQATGRITVTADHGSEASSVDVGPFGPDIPTPVTVPLSGSDAKTLTFSVTGCG